MLFRDSPVVQKCMFPLAQFLLALFNESGNQNVNRTSFLTALHFRHLLLMNKYLARVYLLQTTKYTEGIETHHTREAHHKVVDCCAFQKTE